MPVNKSVVSRVSRGITASVVSAIRRNFTTIAAAGGQYWTIPTVTLTGDFDIDLKVNLPLTLDQKFLGGSIDDTLGWNASGNLEIKIGGSFSTFGVAARDSKVHSFNYKRVGSTITCTLDGLLVGTIASSANFTIDFLARVPTHPTMSGILSDVIISGVGIMPRIYRVDEDWVGPSAVLHDNSGDNQHGLAVNIGASDAELFTRFDNVSPNEFRNGDASVILEIAGT